MKQFRFLVVLMMAVAFAIPSGLPAQQKKFSIGVVPQARPVEVHEKWTPFAKKLSQELGVELEITAYNTMAQFESDLAKGGPDFVYMNPYQMTNVKDYVPLVRDKKTLVGILVAKKGGPINSVKDLNGKEVAFPDPNAFAASLYLRALMTEQENITFKPQYVKTHSNVYRTVAFDRAAGGGGVKMTLGKEADDIKNVVTVIYETPGTASHPLAAHTRVPDALRKKMAAAILDLGAKPANKEMLSAVQLPDPMEADFQRDYAPLQKLKLEKYASKESE